MFTESERTRLSVGLKETKKAILAGAAKVYVAEDAPEHIVDEIAVLAGEELFYVSSMRELGALCGIDVKATCAAVRL